MNEAVKKRQELMRNLCKDIIGKAESMLEDINAIETDDDLAIIEMGFDTIESWGKEGYDIVRNTYDEFEEMDI